MRPVCSGDMYAKVPSSRLAFRATCVSLDSRVAMPKSIILISSSCSRKWCGLMSLWMTARRWMRGDRCGHADRDVEESLQRRTLVAKHRLQRDVAQVLEHQRHAASMFDEAERANDLGQVERRQHARARGGAAPSAPRWVFRSKQLHDHPRAVGVSRASDQAALWVSRNVWANVYPTERVDQLSLPPNGNYGGATACL